jgi:hypothetical protein
MHESVFLQVEFFLLVVFSTVLPAGIYAYMMWKSAISRKAVLLFGVILIVLAGVDIFLLQRLTELAKYSPSVLDDAIFVSELSIALYLLPALFGAVGIDMVSHVLISHLASAERLFDREHNSVS